MEVTELFSEGADVLKRNVIIAGPLVTVGIITGLLTMVFIGGMAAGTGMMGTGMMTSAFSLGAMMGGAFLLLIINGLLNLIAMGMTYVMASEAIGGKADLNSGIEKTLGNIVNLFIASILLGIIVFIGMLLLFLPGLIAAYLLMFSLVLVMLDNRPPVDALKESFELVKSNISETIVFAVIAVVVMFVAGIVGSILGVIPLLGSLILTPIVTGTAMAYISTVLVLLYRGLQK
jgi:uncharacterized membrane protein